MLVNAILLVIFFFLKVHLLWSLWNEILKSFPLILNESIYQQYSSHYVPLTSSKNYIVSENPFIIFEQKKENIYQKKEERKEWKGWFYSTDNLAWKQQQRQNLSNENHKTLKLKPQTLYICPEGFSITIHTIEIVIGWVHCLFEVDASPTVVCFTWIKSIEALWS